MTSCLFIAFAFSLTDNSTRTPDCGERALFTSLTILGIPCNLSVIEKQLHSRNPNEAESLADLAQVAAEYGLYPLAVKLRDPAELSSGAILHVNTRSGHFVSFLGFDGDDVVIGDAPMPPTRVNRDYFMKHWSGNVLLLFKDNSERDAIRFQHVTDNCLFVGAFLWPLVIVCIAGFRFLRRPSPC